MEFSEINLTRPRRYVVKATGADAKSFDFNSARGVHKTTTVKQSIAHLEKSCLGGGVLAIHEAYKHCGLLSAVIFNLLLGMLVAYSKHMVITSVQTMYGRLQLTQLSYPDLAEAAFATSSSPILRKLDKTFRYFVDGAITIDLFGTCAVYTVIMARSIRQLLEIKHPSLGDINIRIYILLFLLPCILICMIINLRNLACFSFVGNLFLVILAMATVIYCFIYKTKSILDFPVIKDVGGVLEFMGVCVFSMAGYGVILPIENHMEEPKKFPYVLMGGMSIVCGIVMTVGFFGYWGFGEESKSPVTLNFPFDGVSLVLKALMLPILYVSFALNFWAPFNLVWVYLKVNHEEEDNWFWERIYRTIFIVLIFCLAVTFPNVSSFMSFLGCFCVCNMGFIFPSIIQLTVEWEDPGLGYMNWRLVRFAAIMAFGIFLFILGTFQNASNLFCTAVQTDLENNKLH